MPEIQYSEVFSMICEVLEEFIRKKADFWHQPPHWQSSPILVGFSRTSQEQNIIKQEHRLLGRFLFQQESTYSWSGRLDWASRVKMTILSYRSNWPSGQHFSYFLKRPTLEIETSQISLFTDLHVMIWNKVYGLTSKCGRHVAAFQNWTPYKNLKVLWTEVHRSFKEPTKASESG